MSELKLDKNEWRLFLKALNKKKDTVRLRAFFPKGHFLKDRDRGKKSHADLQWITDCQKEGRGVYIVVNDGGDTDSSITHCKAFFCEWDDRPKQEQIEAWRHLGLPEPSLQIDTGGKSIHNYWILKKAIDPKTWKPIQERLLDHADADRALKNPSRVMRLPGTHHMNEDGSAGGLTTIINSSDKIYLLEDIEKKLPTAKQHEEVKQSSQYKEYRKEGIGVVEEALRLIPQRKPGSNTYHMYRNILWGLVKACEDAGKDINYAIDLMKSHSPSWGGIDQIAHSGGISINAGSFWYWAIKNGFKPPKQLRKIELNEFSDDSPEAEEIIVSNEPLQKIEGADFLRVLRSLPKNHPKAFKYNIFTQQIERYGEPCQGDSSIERAYLKLQEKKFKIQKDVAYDCIVQVARENQFDPVDQYLESCRTKTPEFIDRLASNYLRLEDQHLTEPTIFDHMLKCTLIAAVARVKKPGCKFDNACVLMGPQGARKSSFWAALGGEFFSDSLKDINGKDSLMTLHSAWISEFAELDYLNTKRQAGEVKAFLSQSSDIFRVPYGKVTETFPRRGIIVGSTNRHDGFLLDDTGSRRFWVIETSCTMDKPIQSQEIKKIRDNIWAGALEAYENDEPHNLPTEIETKINEQNERYLIDNPWKNIIADHVNSPANLTNEFSTDKILTEVIEKPLERQTRYDQMQVSTILKNLGLVKKRRGAKNSRKWVYIRDSQGVLSDD